MKHIVIAQPLAISSALLDTLTADLQKDGFTITAYDSLPKDQDELGDRLADADLAVIANYPLRKEALAKAAYRRSPACGNCHRGCRKSRSP